jgi:hypothetical protein
MKSYEPVDLEGVCLEETRGVPPLYKPVDNEGGPPMKDGVYGGGYPPKNTGKTPGIHPYNNVKTERVSPYRGKLNVHTLRCYFFCYSNIDTSNTLRVMYVLDPPPPPPLPSLPLSQNTSPIESSLPS